MQKSVVFLPTFHPIGNHGAVRKGLALVGGCAIVLTVISCSIEAQDTGFGFLNNISLILDTEVLECWTQV